jgi:hypothetical protein
MKPDFALACAFVIALTACGAAGSRTSIATSAAPATTGTPSVPPVTTGTESMTREPNTGETLPECPDGLTVTLGPPGRLPGPQGFGGVAMSLTLSAVVPRSCHLDLPFDLDVTSPNGQSAKGGHLHATLDTYLAAGAARAPALELGIPSVMWTNWCPEGAPASIRFHVAGANDQVISQPSAPSCSDSAQPTQLTSGGGQVITSSLEAQGLLVGTVQPVQVLSGCGIGAIFVNGSLFVADPYRPAGTTHPAVDSGQLRLVSPTEAVLELATGEMHFLEAGPAPINWGQCD